MIEKIKRINKYLLFAVAFTIAGCAIVGCEYFPESTFELARESRLPKWITLPPGVTRDDVSISMSYYIKLLGPDAAFELKDTNGRLLEKIYGKVNCLYPIQLKSSPQKSPPDYPSYQAISVHDITEIVEHRKMKPIFYITDDPAVWKQYREIGCG